MTDHKKIKEAIEDLEKARQNYNAVTKDTYIDQALAKLKAEQPRCRGRKVIHPESIEQTTGGTHYPKPYPCPGCPDCIEQPPAREFKKNIRDALEVMSSDGKFHRKIMEKALALIDTETQRADKAEAKIYKIRPFADCYKRICETLGIEKDVLNYIKQLEAKLKDLLEACEGLMEKADNGSADFDDPVPGSIYLKAKAAIEKANK